MYVPSADHPSIDKYGNGGHRWTLPRNSSLHVHFQSRLCVVSGLWCGGCSVRPASWASVGAWRSQVKHAEKAELHTQGLSVRWWIGGRASPPRAPAASTHPVQTQKFTHRQAWPCFHVATHVAPATCKPSLCARVPALPGYPALYQAHRNRSETHHTWPVLNPVALHLSLHLVSARMRMRA